MDIWLSGDANPELIDALRAGHNISVIGKIMVFGANTLNPEYELVIGGFILDKPEEVLDKAPITETKFDMETAQKQDLYDCALDNGLSKNFVGRIWNQLATRYFAKRNQNFPFRKEYFEGLKALPFPVEFRFFDENASSLNCADDLDLQSLKVYLDIIAEANNRSPIGWLSVVGPGITDEHIRFLNTFLEAHTIDELAN